MGSKNSKQSSISFNDYFPKLLKTLDEIFKFLDIEKMRNEYKNSSDKKHVNFIYNELLRKFFDENISNELNKTLPDNMW